MKPLIHLFLLGIFSGLAGTVLAADCFWANTGTDFNDGASWRGGVAPGANDVAIFDTPMVTQPMLSASATVRGIHFCDKTRSNWKNVSLDDGYNGHNYSGYVLSGVPGAILTLTGSGGGDGSYSFFHISAGTNRIDVPIAFHQADNQRRCMRVDVGQLVFQKPISTLGANNSVEIAPHSGACIAFQADNSDWTGSLSFQSAGTFLLENARALAGLTTLKLSNWAAGASTGFTTDKIQHIVNCTGETMSFDLATVEATSNDGISFEGAPFDFSKTTFQGDLRSSKVWAINTDVTVQKIRSLGTNNNVQYTKGGTGKLTVLEDFSCDVESNNNTPRFMDGCYLPMLPEGLGSLHVEFYPDKFVDANRPVLGLVRDLEPKLGRVPGGIIFGRDRSRGGFAAFGADRRICFEGDSALVVSNGLALPTDSNFHLFPSDPIFGYAQADATAILENPIDLNNGDRTYYAIKGQAFMDGRILGDITSVQTPGKKLHKRGNGNLALEGTCSYTGFSYVYEGGLFVNGSVACPYEARSLLGGTGTLQNTTVTSTGTLHPGEQGGVLTIEGALSLQANSRLRIQVNETSHGSIRLTGSGKNAQAITPVKVELEFTKDAPISQKIKILDWSEGSSFSNTTAFDPSKYEIVVDPEVLRRAELTVEGTAMFLRYKRVSPYPATVLYLR